MKRLGLLLLLLLVACNEADASRLRRSSGRRGAPTKAISSGSPAVQDIFETYTWTFLYDSVNEADPFPSSGTNNLALTNVVGEPTCAQSTAAYTSSGIGAARVNNGCLFATDTGFTNSGSFPAIADGDEIHIRILVTPTEAAANDNLFYYLESSSEIFYVRIQSSSLIGLSFKIGSATDAGCTLNHSTSGNPMLIDVFFVDNNTTAPGCNAAGTCGVVAYMNGTRTSCGDATVDYSGVGGGGSLGIGRYDGNFVFSGNLIAMGARIGSTVTFTEAQHLADCVAVGICSP